MSKAKRLTSYKDAAEYVADMGCGSETHRPTMKAGGVVVPVMRTGSDGNEQPVMYWRLSNPDPDRLKKVLATFQRSGFRVGAPPDPGVPDTLIGRMVGADQKTGEANGAYYIDVQYEFEEVGPGMRPRIVLVRGKSDPVAEPVAVEDRCTTA